MFRALKSGWTLSLLMMIGVLFADSAQAATREQISKRITDSKRYLEQTMEAPDTAIPKELIKRARAIIILRQYKFGFIFGARGGYGIAMAKDERTGEWSPPAFVKTGEASFGFQVGGQSTDSIFLIMNEKGMDILRKSRFRIGLDASVAAGPIGRDAELKVGPETAILAYSRARGLYAGAAIEGGVMFDDRRANDKFYGGKDLRSTDIIYDNKVRMPSEASDLVRLLNKYSRAD